MNDFDDYEFWLDQVFGPTTGMGFDLEPRTFEKRLPEGYSRQFFVGKMRQWIARGESAEAFISGCREEFRPELQKIAEEENLL